MEITITELDYYKDRFEPIKPWTFKYEHENGAYFVESPEYGIDVFADSLDELREVLVASIETKLSSFLNDSANKMSVRYCYEVLNVMSNLKSKPHTLMIGTLNEYKNTFGIIKPWAVPARIEDDVFFAELDEIAVDEGADSIEELHECVIASIESDIHFMLNRDTADISVTEEYEKKLKSIRDNLYLI